MTSKFENYGLKTSVAQKKRQNKKMVKEVESLERKTTRLVREAIKRLKGEAAQADN